MKWQVFFYWCCMNSSVLLAQEQTDTCAKGGSIFFETGVQYVKHVNFVHRNNPSFSEFNEYYRRIVKNDRLGGYGWHAGLGYLNKNWVVGAAFTKNIFLETYHGELFETGNNRKKQSNAYEYLSLSLNAGKIVWKKNKLSLWWRGGIVLEKLSRTGAFSNSLYENHTQIDGSSELFTYYNPFIFSVQTDIRLYYKIHKVQVYADITVTGNMTDVLKDGAPFHNKKVVALLKAGMMFPMFQFR